MLKGCKSNGFTGEKKKDTKYTYDVTMRNFRVTIVAVETQ